LITMRTKIIAEIGVNWRDLNEADIMIQEAVLAGADIAKFQAYPLDLFPEGTTLNAIALKPADMAYLYYRCHSHGIEFMATPMYFEAVAMLNPYVDRWKIRHKDAFNNDILIRAAMTNKPLLISGRNLYCVPEYPPLVQPIEEIPFPFIGVSSHYPNVPTLLYWAQQGLQYMEVHVKRDEHYGGWCPPDNNVSITMSELGDLCDFVGEYYG